MKKKIFKIINKAKNQDGYVEFFFTIFVFCFLISILIAIAPPFITREKVSIITRKTVEKVEFDGKVTPQTYTFVDNLINKANLTSKNPKYSFTGNIRPNGKIQLRDEFHFKINVTEKIKLTGFDATDINMPIQKELTGISEVFYKSSEL
ncbi:DUF4320 family protein [Peptoanaerobacter stomatis]